jgi:hypothetical protein
MKKWTQKKILLTSLALLAGSSVFAQSKSVQVQCKAKAKEVAKVAYNECLSTSRYDEAENIRKEYRAKITKLKAFYEAKLKKINLKAGAATTKPGMITPPPSTLVNTTGLPQKIEPTTPEVPSEVATFTPPPPVNTAEVAIAPPAPVNVAPEPTIETLAPTTGGSTETSVPATTITPESTPMESNEPVIRLKPYPPKNQGSDQLDSEPELTI